MHQFTEAALGTRASQMTSTSFTAAAALAFGTVLLVAGCNDWPDRLPQVASSAQAQAGTDAKADVVAGVPAVAQPPQSAADASLSSEVESALKSEPDLHGVSIAVRTDSGVVTLTGTTKDPQLRSMAAEVALSVDGVKLVKNEITLGAEA